MAKLKKKRKKLEEIREKLDSLSIDEYFEDKTLEIVYDTKGEKFEINEKPKDAKHCVIM